MAALNNTKKQNKMFVFFLFVNPQGNGTCLQIFWKKAQCELTAFRTYNFAEKDAMSLNERVVENETHGLYLFKRLVRESERVL